MKKLDENLLREVVNRLVCVFEPQKVILFGSHAWGKTSQESDVDLLVIVGESAERPAMRSRRAHALMDGIMAPLDILVKTRAEIEKYRNLPTSLENQILSRGKVLYG